MFIAILCLVIAIVLAARVATASMYAAIANDYARQISASDGDSD